MRRWWREPLLHFLLLGAAIFGVYAWSAPRAALAPAEIVVTRGRIDGLAAGFTRARGRAPTREELNELFRDYVREEVYYREALALGLDRDDTVIRRRLRQKMEFLSEDTAAAAQPREQDLQTYFQQHIAQYRTEARLSFDQIFLDPHKPGAHLERDAQRLLARLNTSGDAASEATGDTTLLEPHYEDVTPTDIAAQFGERFARQLPQAPLGRWVGPFESAYGAHLVHVTMRAPERAPLYAEVESRVRRDWTDAQRIAANEALYQSLLRHYQVRVEGQ